MKSFNQNAKGVEGTAQEALGTTIFRARVELLETFRHVGPVDESINDLDKEISDKLRTEVETMNIENFVVRPHRKLVEKFREPATWEELESNDVDELDHILSGLPNELDSEDETAKRIC